MKNVLILLVCFAFAGVTANAQTSIPTADQGTYVLDGGSNTLVVTATGIEDGTSVGSGGSSISDENGAAVDGSGASTDASGSTNQGGVLSNVRKSKSGQWGGEYTMSNGKVLKVAIAIDRASNAVTLTDTSSGKVVAKYLRPAQD
ncbi:MAG: hypothetical protein K9I85_13185 [Saprospiraceae bacterium]|nr:hypothetical protein [Saprospiraceae bacterium]